MTQTITAAERYLREPRLPKTSPVTILHLRAKNDTNGNPRRCFAVLTTDGRTVEVHDEGYRGDAAIQARWPWFSHTAAARLGLRVAYTRGVDVTPGEYRAWLRQGDDLDTETPELVRLRKMGDRAGRFMALRDALVSVRRATAEHEWREHRAKQEGRENHYGDTRAAVVYHRDPWLRRAIGALVRAGALDATYRDESHGQYRATENTPDLY